MSALQSTTAAASAAAGLPHSEAYAGRPARKGSARWNTAKRSFRRHWQLYLILLPGLLYFIIFKYIPMVNAVIAFKDYNVVAGIWGSPYAGTPIRFDDLRLMPATAQ